MKEKRVLLNNSTTDFYNHAETTTFGVAASALCPSHFQQGPDRVLGRQRQNLHDRRDRELTGCFRHSVRQMPIARVLFTHARELDHANTLQYRKKGRKKREFLDNADDKVLHIRQNSELLLRRSARLTFNKDLTYESSADNNRIYTTDAIEP